MLRKFRKTDVKVIKNGTTTVVIHNADLKYNQAVVDNINDTYDHLAQLFFFSGSAVVTKGVSKLCPGDTYDEVTGKIVASKKAELKADKILKKRLARVYGELVSLTSDVVEYIRDLDDRDEDIRKSLDK